MILPLLATIGESFGKDNLTAGKNRDKKLHNEAVLQYNIDELYLEDALPDIDHGSTCMKNISGSQDITWKN